MCIWSASLGLAGANMRKNTHDLKNQWLKRLCTKRPLSFLSLYNGTTFKTAIRETWLKAARLFLFWVTESRRHRHQSMYVTKTLPSASFSPAGSCTCTAAIANCRSLSLWCGMSPTGRLLSSTFNSCRGEKKTTLNAGWVSWMERGACCGAYVSRVSALINMQRQGFGSERLRWEMGAQLEETVWGEIKKGKKKNIWGKKGEKVQVPVRGVRERWYSTCVVVSVFDCISLGVECVRIRECEQ